MPLLHYLSYGAILAAFAFVTLSLASGLLYVSELIEEHTRLAKQIGQRGIYAVIALHFLLYFTDNLPLPQTVFSIFCHIVYLQNFSITWPLISLTSLTFLGSCALVVADHFLWFFYFARLTQQARQLRTYRSTPPTPAPGFTEIASFFGICVWLAPLFLFLSLSANDNALPTSTAEPGSPSVSTNHSLPQRVSLFRSILNVIPTDRLPRLRSKPPRRDSDEGLLAPRSPLPPSPLGHHQTTFSPSSYIRPPSPLIGPPPRSPGLKPQDLHIDTQVKTSTIEFKLTPPPGRRPIRRANTGDGAGLGLRRTHTSESLLDSGKGLSPY